ISERVQQRVNQLKQQDGRKTTSQQSEQQPQDQNRQSDEESPGSAQDESDSETITADDLDRRIAESIRRFHEQRQHEVGHETSAQTRARTENELAPNPGRETR